SSPMYASTSTIIPEVRPAGVSCTSTVPIRSRVTSRVGRAKNAGRRMRERRRGGTSGFAQAGDRPFGGPHDAQLAVSPRLLQQVEGLVAADEAEHHGAAFTRHGVWARERVADAGQRANAEFDQIAHR